MNLNLKGKCALVTAASRGLGRACAEALALEGADVAICSRNIEQIRKTANEISINTGGNVRGFVCDLANSNDIDLLLSELRTHFKKIDILVFNNGNLPPGSFSQVNMEQWHLGISMCLMPAIQLCNALISNMKENNWGRIIFINSIFAKEPDPNYIISSTLRSGLLNFAKCIARELATNSITVNSVLPGYFETPLLRSLAEEEGTRINKDARHVLNVWANMIPTNKLANPDQLGYLVAFLSSDLSENISGASIPIDGCMAKSL